MRAKGNGVGGSTDRSADWPMNAEPRPAHPLRRRAIPPILVSDELDLTRETKAIWTLMSDSSLALSQLSEEIPQDHRRMVRALADQMAILTVRFRLKKTRTDRSAVLRALLSKVSTARQYIHQNLLRMSVDTLLLRRSVLGLTRLERHIEGIGTKPPTVPNGQQQRPRSRGFNTPDRSLIKPQ